MLLYTTIQHGYRKENDLTCNEYVICDMVFILSKLDNSDVPGWCYMSRDNMADEIGISRRGILKMIDRLIEKGFLIKNPQSKYLKTTIKWQEVLKYKNVVGVNKVHYGGEQSALEGVNKVHPIIYSNNNNNNNRESPVKKKLTTEEIKKDLMDRKEKFWRLIEVEKDKKNYPDELYKKFYGYWTERNEVNGNGTEMRFEDKKKYYSFEVSKRLATFWRTAKEWEKDAMKNKEVRREEEEIEEAEEVNQQPGLFTELLKQVTPK